jgi:hypothetical protein
MTQGDKDAIYGRAKREEKEAKQHLAFLLVEATRLSAELVKFANVFSHNSHLVQAEGNEFVVTSGIPGRDHLERFSHTDFDAERIVILIRDLHAARERHRNAEAKVKELEGE